MDVTIYTYCILKDASTRGSGVKPPTLRSHDDHTATNQEVHKFRGKELISSCCTALCGVMLHFWPHPTQWCHNNWLAYYKNTFSFYFSQKGAETGVTTHWHYYDTSSHLAFADEVPVWGPDADPSSIKNSNTSQCLYYATCNPDESVFHTLWTPTIM